MLPAGLIAQPREFRFALLKVTIDALTVGKVEGQCSEDLLEAEGRKRFYNAVGGLAPQKGVNDRIEGHSRPQDVIPTVPMLDVLTHRCTHIQYTLPEEEISRFGYSHLRLNHPLDVAIPSM